MRFKFTRLEPQRFAVVTSLALWSLIAIVITGASVRLTGSGLGCSDWPACEPGELVPAADFHAWIEFGNRLVTGFVALAVIAAVSGSLLRVPRRADLVWWSAALVTGVLAQVILGGITVLTHLSPPIVMGHFLLSSVLVAAATVLASRARVPDGDLAAARQARQQAGRAGLDRSASRSSASQTITRVRAGCWALAVLVSVALFTGTLVTATGPHGGDEDVERLGLALGDVARVHGITVIVTLALLLSLVAWLARRVAAVAATDSPSDSPADSPGLRAQLLAVLRRLEILLVVLAVQGVVGYVQYFNQLPVLLVGIHVAGATLAVVALTRLIQRV